MKRLLVVVGLMLFLPSGVGAQVLAKAERQSQKTARSPRSPRQTVDRIVAVVETEIITLRELEEKAAPYLAQLEGHENDKDYHSRRQRLLKQVLDIEIGERMLQKEITANQERLNVTEQEVDRAIEEVQRLNGVDQEQLQAALYAQGMTWSEYRDKIKEQLARARLVQFKMQGKVAVDDSEAKQQCLASSRGAGEAFKVCASHILLATSGNLAQEDRQKLYAKATRLQSELYAGADFASYAMNYSDDKGAPDGALGCFGRGEMVETFENMAFKTPIGSVSPVVETQFGFHIIKVTGHMAAESGDCTTEIELAPYRNAIYQQKMEEQMKIWMDELRRKAFVEIRL